eukprot:3312991-Pyramimonas_sp.AAC.1
MALARARRRVVAAPGGRGAGARRVRLEGGPPVPGVHAPGVVASWMDGESRGEEGQSERWGAAERKQAGNGLFNYIVAAHVGSKPMTAKDACI